MVEYMHEPFIRPVNWSAILTLSFASSFLSPFPIISQFDYPLSWILLLLFARSFPKLSYSMPVYCIQTLCVCVCFMPIYRLQTGKQLIMCFCCCCCCYHSLFYTQNLSFQLYGWCVYTDVQCTIVYTIVDLNNGQLRCAYSFSHYYRFGLKRCIHSMFYTYYIGTLHPNSMLTQRHNRKLSIPVHPLVTCNRCKLCACPFYRLLYIYSVFLLTR